MNIPQDINTYVKNAFSKLEYAETLNPHDSIWNVRSLNQNYSIAGLSRLAKSLKEHKINKTIEDIVNDIIEQLAKDNTMKDKYDISTKNNFLNVSIKTSYLASLVSDNFIKNNNLIQQTTIKKNIIVDFSSPNIAKDMHVGHLRSTIIGDTICKLLESQGHQVHRINHIGDFGTQFGMLIQYLYDNHPKFKTEDINIGDLQVFYAASKKCFDTDEEFKKNSYQRVVELQNGDKEVVEAWEYIKDISRLSYNEIYKRLNIKLEEVGESFYQDKIPDLVKELSEKNLLEKDDGRQIIKIPNYKLPYTVVKSNGSYTYDTTDLAAIRYRLVEKKADCVYYVVGCGQEVHFNQLIEISKMAGWLTNQDVRHIGFGLVLGEDGKAFKSRNGDTVKLMDLLDESVKKTGDVLNSKNTSLTYEQKEKVTRSIAYGAVKYADLSSTRTKNYKFSYDSMLALNGNTAVYLLYAYVRILAIFRTAGEHFKIAQTQSNLDGFKIEEIEEIALANHILLFNEIVNNITETFHFHTLSNYLYNLSKIFHNFITKHRCLHFAEDKKTIVKANYNRLLLCKAVSKIMAECFDLLNIETIEYM